MNSISTSAEGHGFGACAKPRRKPRRRSANASALAPGEAIFLARPAFPPWARTCRGTGDGRIVASQNAEGREAKVFAAQDAVEWLSEGKTCQGTAERFGEPITRGDGRRVVSENAEELSDSRGSSGSLVWDDGEGRGAPGVPGAPGPSAAEAAFLAGAALAALDPLMRSEGASFRGCFGARLALRAAAASAKILGRAEDEAALRDAVCLCPPGGDPGPAGRLLAAFRSLAGRRPDLIFCEEAAGKLLAGLGLPSLLHDPEPDRARPVLTEMLGAAAALAQSTRPAIFAAAETAALTCQSLAPNAGRAGAIFALVLADAVLSRRLGWPLFVPLLTTSKEAGQASLRVLRTARNPSGTSTHLDGAQTPVPEEAVASFCLGAAEAAAHAHDLFRGLARRAGKLESALPKLRAKGAASALEKILSDDAVTAAMRPGGLSDRAARRLFGRLAALGVLRELSGRPAFRLHGL